MDRKQTDVRDQDLMSHPRHFLRAIEDDGVMRLPAGERRRSSAADAWHPSGLEHADEPAASREPPRAGFRASAGALFQRGETSIVLLVVALTALGYLSLPG